MQAQLQWTAFAAWMLPGALLSFSILAMFSIGWLVLPIAVLVVVIVAMEAPRWPHVFGLPVGAALPLLWVGFGHLWRSNCDVPAGGAASLSGVVSVSGNERGSNTIVLTQHCTSFDSWPWIWTGITLALIGLLLYGLALRWSGGSGHDVSREGS